jgi:ABC-type glutathione transport system ATPase component
MSDCLLQTENLGKTYSSQKERGFQGIREVSIHIAAGECVGLVGESGAGKSTLARILVGLTEQDAGRFRYSIGRRNYQFGTSRRHRSQWRQVRHHVQIVFQNPFTSLNPALTVGRTLEEVLMVHDRRTPPAQRSERVHQILHEVGLPADVVSLVPSQLSGGQCQRVSLARALMVAPQFLILDEVTSALDVSSQMRILQLLRSLRDLRQLTYLFISHNLRLVRLVSDRVYVLKDGTIVDSFEASQENFSHPYSQKLFSRFS